MTAAGPTAIASLNQDGLDGAVASWLASFNSLETGRFLAFFAADASVFMPMPSGNPLGGRRVEPENLTREWTELFARFRKSSSRTQPPFMNIAPQDVCIDHLGRGAAVVTFHLGEGPWTGRRSLAWRREAEGWRIVHVHASRLSETTPPPR